MSFGHRIFREVGRPSPEIVAQLGQYFSADLADAMKKSGAVSTAIKPLYKPMKRFAGPAVTASLPTASFGMAKIAMDLCQAGDVLILNSHGDVGHAMLGGHIAHALKVRGLVGVIVDGAVRDVSEFQHEDLGVFARGTAVIVGGMDGPGEINVPVACGGIVVNPGDIIVADEDGIVAIPQEFANEVLASVVSLKQKHAAGDEFYDRGELPGIAELEQSYAAIGCEFVGVDSRG